MRNMLQRAALHSLVCLTLPFVAAAAHAQAAENRWFIRSDIQGLLGAYTGTQQREALGNLGFFLRADYLERAGITVGYNRTLLSLEDGTRDIDQDSLFVSGRWHTTPDWVRGQLTFRLDGYTISNDDMTRETDDATVIAPQVSYLNYQRTFYADLGFSKSSYGDSQLTPERLEVDQLTPTLGFGFNAQGDWLQLRGYLIDPSSSQRAQNQEDTAAMELKWTHWMGPSSFLGIDNFRVSGMLGERVYAVDPDAGGVYNLAELQTGGASLGGEWVPNERSRILLLLGVERFENQVDREYHNIFMYLNFTHHWN